MLSPLIVTSPADSGPGSLRAIISTAPSGSTIEFAHSVHSVTLTSGDLDISTNLNIEGPGANRLTISGNSASRVFDISGSASVSISGLTITHGLATAGGGILLEGSASLSLSNCTVSDNVASGGAAGTGFGGGIEDTSSGTLTVTACTFDGNKAIATGPNTVPGTPGPTYAKGYRHRGTGGGIDLSFVRPAARPQSVIARLWATRRLRRHHQRPVPVERRLAQFLVRNIPGTSMTVTGCTLSGNVAIGEAGGDGITNFGSGQGGGINDVENLTVQNSTLNGNLAQGTPLAPGAVPSQTPSSGSTTAGGGVFCLGVYVPNAAVSLTGSTLSGNQSRSPARRGRRAAALWQCRRRGRYLLDRRPFRPRLLSDAVSFCCQRRSRRGRRNGRGGCHWRERRHRLVIRLGRHRQQYSPP